MPNDPPIRVLHLTADFWPNLGGVEQFVLDLASLSHRAGIDARVLCYNRVVQHEGRLPAEGEINGVPIRRVGFLNLGMYRPSLLPLRMLRDADVIHVHGVRALLDYAVLMRPLHRRPIILSTHGGVFHGQSFALLKRAYFYGFNRLLQAGVDQTIACSQSDLELFKPIARRLILIENGVDTARFNLPRDPALGSRFLYLGRFDHHKRVERLIETFARVRAAGHDFSLRLAGPDVGHIEAHLKSLAQERGIGPSVTFPGKVPDTELAQEYARADYFVSASEYEGFGISVIEAMAAGCIPILQGNPAFSHMVAHGTDGYLTDFADAHASAELIGGLLAKPPTVTSTAARARAQRFSWDAKLPEFIDVYRRVIRESGSAA